MMKCVEATQAHAPDMDWLGHLSPRSTSRFLPREPSNWAVVTFRFGSAKCAGVFFFRFAHGFHVEAGIIPPANVLPCVPVFVDVEAEEKVSSPLMLILGVRVQLTPPMSCWAVAVAAAVAMAKAEVVAVAARRWLVASML
jgi:hypothetical protein